jgi:capsular exopolysaccharide synthesis family protein
VNLAVVLAQGGLRTLIVDANLRRPAVASMLSGAQGEEAPAAETGLVDLLVDGGDAASQIQPTTLENLSVLPAGTPTAYATELLSSPATARVLEEARGEFDAIVIDSPPCSALADPLAIAPLCSQVLLVLRLCKTRRERAQQAAERLQDLPAPTPQLILNAQAAPKGWYDY